MPIYEYECEKCHETFEEIQSIHDAPSAKCPSCGGKSKRMISKPAILFKGSGFHITDYSGKPESKSSSKPEPKPQAPPAPKPSKPEKSSS